MKHHLFMNAGLSSLFMWLIVTMISCAIHKGTDNLNLNNNELVKLILDHSERKNEWSVNDTILVIVNDQGLNKTLFNWIDSNNDEGDIINFNPIDLIEIMREFSVNSNYIYDNDQSKYILEKPDLEMFELWLTSITDVIWMSDIYSNNDRVFVLQKSRNSGEGWINVLDVSSDKYELIDRKMLFVN